MKLFLLVFTIISLSFWKVDLCAKNAAPQYCGMPYVTFRQKVKVFDEKVNAFTYETLLTKHGKDAMDQQSILHRMFGYYSLICDKGNEAVRISGEEWASDDHDGEIFLLQALGYLQQGRKQDALNLYKWYFDNVFEEPFSTYRKYLALLILKAQLCPGKSDSSNMRLCTAKTDSQSLDFSMVKGASETNVIKKLLGHEKPSARDIDALPTQLKPTIGLIEYLVAGKPSLQEVIKKYGQQEYELLSNTET